MIQTLLALLALALSSLFVLNQQRLSLGSQQLMVGDEIDLAAAGLATEILEMIAARSFDETTTPLAIRLGQDIPIGPAAFSLPAAFGAVDGGSEGCNFLVPAITPDCDDVDDVSGRGWALVEAELAGGRTLPFEASAVVVYVAEPASAVPSAVPTLHKRVTLSMRSLLPGRTGREVVTLHRVVSYDPVKAEFDFERVYGAFGTQPL